MSGQEDCLFLTISSPGLVSEGLKPVMVWIHGGGFIEGDIGTFHDPEFLIDEDIVYVGLQYRLGILGFLALENSASLTGNLGLKDQQEALRWIQRNIAFFGGDPARVTIFGESAGGVSVHAHVLSPPARGLFRAAIMQSGTALLTYERLVQRRTEAEGRRLVEDLGCGEATDMLACLQQLDLETFIGPGIEAKYIWPVQVVGRQSDHYWTNCQKTTFLLTLFIFLRIGMNKIL